MFGYRLESDLLAASADGLYVRRLPSAPVISDVRQWILSMQGRSVVIEKYPTSEELDNMQAYFEQYGSVAHIERRIRGYNGAKDCFYNVDLVIYLREDSVRNIVKLKHTAIRRMGLYIHYGNEFVNDCVRYFYDKRVAGVRGDHLKPVKKTRPQHQYDTSSVALPRRSAPQFGDGSGDQVVSSGRPDRQRNVWWRSGMRCVDAGAKISEPPDYRVDQQQDEEVEPRSRRTRFRAHNSEPDNKMDMDWVMSQIDQIDFHESKNKLSSDNCTAAPANAYNASSSMSATCLPISSDVGNLSPVAGETLAQSSISRSYTNVSNHEPRSLPSGDGLATSSLQSSDTASCMRNASLVTTPPKAGSFADAHIPQLKSVAGDTSTEQLDTRDLPSPLRSGPLEPVQRDEHGSEVLACQTSDQIDSFSQLSQSVVHDLPARGDAVLAYPVADDDILVDEVAIIERDSSGEREEVVSSSQLIPVGHDSQPQMSSDNIHTRRLLSADAAYCLQQEDDDVIVESSFEEDFEDE